MRHLLALARPIITATAATAAPCSRGTVTGEVTHVRDGDTIVVGTMPIRLDGLAAPEWNEPGGQAAGRAMLELVDGRTLPVRARRRAGPERLLMSTLYQLWRCLFGTHLQRFGKSLTVRPHLAGNDAKYP